MSEGIQVVGLYVRDQDEAYEFYVGKLGFRVHTDQRNGDYRWLTVQHPEQRLFQLGLFRPQAPIHDPATARALILASPAGIERFFAEVGREPVAGQPPPSVTAADVERLMAAAPKYGIEIEPPG